MSREAIAAVLLFAAGLADLTGSALFAWTAAACALAFVYCQARMLRAARGIPAWRAPRIVPLGLATALAEGAGLMFVIAPAQAAAESAWIAGFGVLLLVRMTEWLAYRQQLSQALRDDEKLDRAGRSLLMVGTLLPAVLLAVLARGIAGDALQIVLAVTAGLMASAAGAFMKFTLITGAGFNQGFALAHLPVRGVRR